MVEDDWEGEMIKEEERVASSAMDGDKMMLSRIDGSGIISAKCSSFLSSEIIAAEDMS